MHSKTIHCDQAIHTSLRTATGEGYRIVAASKGLRSQEKQVITRTSPTLDSICLPPERSNTEPLAVAFYRLRSKRLCLALSCFAGEEHTGRGGKRVYTINVVFNEDDFSQCGYNPFRMIRSLIDAGLGQPQLKPNPVLPVLELCVCDDDDLLEGAQLPAILPESFRPFILDRTLRGKTLVVDVEDEWTECTEAMILGVPGPMRAELSFSAGLNFSTSRKHMLQFLNDDKGKAKVRCPTIGAMFLQSKGQPPPTKGVSDWSMMVARHWREGRLADLSRKTSRPYDDTGEDARERLAALFETQDDIPQIEVARLVVLADEILHHSATGAEKTVCAEFIAKVGESITARLSTLPAQDEEVLFSDILSLWRQDPEATRFANPIIDAIMRHTMLKNPLAAAQMALRIVQNVPAATDRTRHESLLKDIATQFAAWATRTQDAELAQVPELIQRWQSARPDSPELEGVTEHCATVLAEIGVAN